MCLAVFALGLSDRFPFVLAANRDELFARPAAPLGWWRPEPTAGTPAPHPLLAGRDLTAGGTWLGLNPAGRLALLTNIRNGAGAAAAAPSRGAIVTQWLAGDAAPEDFGRRLVAVPYGGFNLVAADLARGQCHWFSSGRAAPQALAPGLYGISNGQLDEPWPKVLQLRERVAAALSAPGVATETLLQQLLAELRDATRWADDRLPDTGVPLDMERLLSSIFILSTDGRYGTRCSTVVVCERPGGGAAALTHVVERSYDGAGRAIGDQSVQLPGWPPAR